MKDLIISAVVSVVITLSAVYGQEGGYDYSNMTHDELSGLILQIQFDIDEIEYELQNGINTSPDYVYNVRLRETLSDLYTELGMMKVELMRK